MESEFERCISFIGTNGDYVREYRRAYVALFGDVPQGYELHHFCWSDHCVNGWHLMALSLQLHRRLHPTRPPCPKHIGPRSVHRSPPKPCLAPSSKYGKPWLLKIEQ